MKFRHQNQKGFTLIELLVVISIIGTVASVVLASLSSARKHAEDTKRLEDMSQIRTALEMFHQDYGRYPDFANEGIPNTGQCIGVGMAIDTALAPYLNPVPNDPQYDAGNCSPGEVAVATYYYAYDPQHPVDYCDLDPSNDLLSDEAAVFGFFTAAAANPATLLHHTCTGNINMKFDTSAYNQAISH